jgi:hypothetical protein
MFMIGIDPHKGSHTAAAVDRAEAEIFAACSRLLTLSSSPAPAEKVTGVRGPPRPGDEHRLEEQAVASRGIGVQAEHIVTVDELADVAREHGDEEDTHCEAEQGSAASYKDQRRTERDLDQAGQDDDHVLVDPDPIGHLSLEVLAGKRQVADPGDDESATEDDPRNGAGASRSRDHHCSYRTAKPAPISQRRSNTTRRVLRPCPIGSCGAVAFPSSRLHGHGKVIPTSFPPVSSAIEARHSADRRPHFDEAGLARLRMTPHELASVCDAEVGTVLRAITALGAVLDVVPKPSTEGLINLDELLDDRP